MRIFRWFTNANQGSIMKLKFATTCFVLTSIIGVSYAYAEDSDADRAHPTAFVKDSVITTKVKAKLAHAHMRSLKNIQVDTDNAGVVVLSGSVRSQKELDKAGEIARGTEHVVSVTNNLQIKKDD